MKKFILSFGLGLLLISCGGSGDDKKTTEESKEETKADVPATTDLSSNPDYQAGLGLVAKNDCLTCHKIVWGEVAMTAHPTVSQGDAEAMVKYIMLLKK